MSLSLTGQGDAAPKRQGGGARGDLYLFISLKPHELFERDSANLYCRAPMTMTTAALGGCKNLRASQDATQALLLKIS